MKRKKHKPGFWALTGYLLIGIAAAVIPAKLFTRRRKNEDSYKDHRFI